MVRIATYAGILLPIGALLNAGCGNSGIPEGAAQPAEPAAFVELSDIAPGPWKRLQAVPLVAAVPADESSVAPEAAGSTLPPVDDVLPDDAKLEGVDETITIISESISVGEPESNVDVRVLSQEAPQEEIGPIVPEEVEQESQPLDNELSAVADEPGVVDEPSAVEADEPELPRSQLPWANTAPRSQEMAVVARRADAFVRRGLRLASRGAIYSAKAEFVSALQVIARANDDQQGTKLYTKALSSGLTALREAGEFLRQGATLSDSQLAHMISGHKTPILKSADPQELTLTYAAKRYYTYAQEQLAVVAVGETGGSMALFGLGKAVIAQAGGQKVHQLEKTAAAMTLYQAALMADSRNFLAANELGVLLAENGHVSRARDVLVQSISASAQRATWHNLAIVHARLGETQLAERARAEAANCPPLTPNGAAPAVQWLDPAAFARTTSVSDSLLGPAIGPKESAPQPHPATAAAKPPVTTVQKPNSWLPWNTRR